MAQSIVKMRIETIESPKQAVEDSVKMARELLEEIKKNFQINKPEIGKNEKQAS